MTRRTQRGVRMHIMRRLVLLSFLLAVPMLAQTGDLSVRFTSDTYWSNPESFTYAVRVRWTGPEPAQDVVLTLNLPGTIRYVAPWLDCTQTTPIRCTIGSLTNDREYLAELAVVLPGAGKYLASASVTTSTPEGPGDNNLAWHEVTVSGLPSLRGHFRPHEGTVDPGGVGKLDLTVSNNGAAATNVLIRARIEEGAILSVEPWYGVPATCTITNGELACQIPAISSNGGYVGMELTYRAPDRREGGTVVATGFVVSERGDEHPENDTFRGEVVLRRRFTVTSTGDAGEGTLRQAILDSNAACETTHCTIAFEGVAGLRPRTPLPELRGLMRIDGGEPRVVLDGSLLSTGDGLLFTSGCTFEVRNLVIRNFPGHGIEAREASTGACSLGAVGVFVSHSELAHNERGIVAKGLDASLQWNVIHDQRRAGIFIDGSFYSEIRNNVVVNNGASGIFINTSAELMFNEIPAGAAVVENVVHGNGEWGIARTRNSGLVQIQRNSTARNRLYGIDVGLDLATLNRPDDSSGGVPNKPLIESATYDPASDTTVIRVSATTQTRVDLYASTSLSLHGHPESEIYLGEQFVPPSGRIELQVAGDLRGLWITGTATRTKTLYFLRDEEAKPRTDLFPPAGAYDTSELSDPLRVQ